MINNSKSGGHEAVCNSKTKQALHNAIMREIGNAIITFEPTEKPQNIKKKSSEIRLQIK